MANLVKLELVNKIDFLISIKAKLEPLMGINGLGIFRQLSHTQFEWCDKEAVEKVRNTENVFEKLQMPRVMKKVGIVRFSNNDSIVELAWNKHNETFTVWINGEVVKRTKTLKPCLLKVKMLIENELLIICDKEDAILSK